MPRSRNECEDISDQRAKERNLGGILAQQFFRPLHHQVQSAGRLHATGGGDDCNDHQHYIDGRGGRLQSKYESEDGQSQATQYPQPDAAEAGTDNNCN